MEKKEKDNIEFKHKYESGVGKARSEYQTILNNIYKNNILLDEKTENIKNIINNFNPMYSSLRGINEIGLIIMRSITLSLKNITIVLYIKTKKENIIFGVLVGAKDDKTIKNFSFIEKNTTFSRVFISPSFISSDGEYRTDAINVLTIFDIYKSKKYKDIIETIETYIREKILKNSWKLLNHEIYPDIKTQSKTDNISYIILSKGIPLKVLTIGWFSNFYKVYYNISEININNSYINIIFKDKNEDIAFFKKLINNYGKKLIDDMLDVILNKNSAFWGPKIGQKLIPLSYAEVENPFNIYYDTWKELFIYDNLSALMLNGINANFSYLVQWEYIKSKRGYSAKWIFDNYKQYERIERGEIAKEIIKLLIEAKKYTEETINEYVEGKSSSISSPILNNKFKDFHKLINNSIEYGTNNILVSNVILNLITTYEGRTFMDIMYILNKSKEYNDNLYNPLSNFSVFSKYIFDVCYDLLCLNKYFYIIHGDLHLNNLVFKYNKIMHKDVNKFKKLNSKKLIFIDENYKFLFPNTLYSIAIIDFSRSIIHPDYAHNLFLPKYNKYFPINIDKKFKEKQEKNLLEIFIYLLPDMANKKDSIKLILKNNFDACFKIMTLLDLYNFSLKTSILFKQSKKDLPKINKECIELIENIYKLCEQYLITNINELLINKEHEKKILNDDWPIISIMKKLFINFIHKEIDINEKITDINILKDEIKYTSKDINTLSPLLTTKLKTDKGRKWNESNIKYFKIKEKEIKEAISTIKLISSRHKKKLGDI